jgi:hypothetical protein
VAAFPESSTLGPIRNGKRNGGKGYIPAIILVRGSSKAFANPDRRSENQQILNIKNLVKIFEI